MKHTSPVQTLATLNAKTRKSRQWPLLVQVRRSRLGWAGKAKIVQWHKLRSRTRIPHPTLQIYMP